ncbi:MAG: LysM peptidoglycan-binding domain-containing protein [Chloroflexi bacterium]|nr:LysM peptidoglycan-binding domain-containing protein [Chloroflexota bacterium]
MKQSFKWVAATAVLALLVTTTPAMAQQTTAPGQTGNTPGQSGTTPGQSGNTPAQGAPPPGQSGTTPGQSGTNPGQSGTTPGQSGTAPGQQNQDNNRGGNGNGQGGQGQTPTPTPTTTTTPVPTPAATRTPTPATFGNSGTIKVSSDPLLSTSMANEPKPGCVFYIIGFGFPTASGVYSIEPQPANGQGPAGTTRLGDTRYAEPLDTPFPVIVRPTSRPNERGFDFQIGPITTFAAGQYKVRVNSDQTPGGDKQKVFRLDCAAGVSEEQSNTVGGQSVGVEKTALDASTVGPENFAGKQITYNIVVRLSGDVSTSTAQRILLVDSIPNCSGFAEFVSAFRVNAAGADLADPGLQITINGCTMTVLGDDKPDVGNRFHVKVRVTRPTTGPVPQTLTNRVTAEILGAPGTANAAVSLPVGGTGATGTGSTISLISGAEVTLPVVSPTFQQTTAAVQGQALAEVAGITVGQSVSVPAGANVVQSGETVAIAGPVLVAVAGQMFQVPEGEVLVLGVQAQRTAPNTGVGTSAVHFVYTVQPGDSLDSIAASYYGDAAFAADLARANQGLLEQGSFAPGLILTLP